MIFVSHSSKDTPTACELRAWLLGKGYDPAQIFLDSDADSGIQAGADWKESFTRRAKALFGLDRSLFQPLAWVRLVLV